MISKFLIVITFLILISCSKDNIQYEQNIENNQQTQRTDSIRIKEKGMLVIDLLKLKEQNGNVRFYNRQKTLVLEVNNNFVISKGKRCNYYDENCEYLIKGFSVLDFEFDLFVINCLHYTNDSFYVFLNNDTLSISKTNSLIHYQSYQEYLKKNIIELDTLAPLFENPSTNSAIIKGYERYHYTVIEFKNNWVKLEVDKEEFDTTFTGWSIWQRYDTLLIKPVYLL